MINDGALTYEERKALGFGVQKLVDDRITALQAQLDALYTRRNDYMNKADALSKECEPLEKEKKMLKAAREKLSW